jgi:hypothetical protein
MQFLAPAIQSRAVAADIQSRGVAKTAKELRKLIPAELIIRMLVETAVTGLLPAYDRNGDEVAAATPIDPKTRLDTLRYLADKRVPNPKVEDEGGRDFDPTTLPASVKEAQELTPAELDEAIAATFTITPETSPCPPQKATDGSSSPGTSAPTRLP